MWFAAAAALLALALPACGGARSTRRTVLADYNNDDYANGYQAFFPRFISAHPGDTIEFRQAWTGDPHTVTLGRLVDAAAKPLLPYLKGAKQLSDQPPQDVIDAFAKLPSFFDPDVNQLAAQPCYIKSGDLPLHHPCPKAEQREPEFHGTETFFNSGFIPFAGVGGNRFSLKLAQDIKPGEYAFNCVVHGPQMTGTITVAPKSTDIGGQARINSAAHKEISRFDRELRRLHDTAAALRDLPAGVDIVAGAAPQGNNIDGYDDREFFPSTFHATVGQKVTWLISTEPAHTVSFDVPRYLPVIIVGKDGTVMGNPETTEPRNTSAAEAYDGTKFLSSGASFEGPMRFSVTFTKPGTYHYACLLHPRMVGELVVK